MDAQLQYVIRNERPVGFILSTGRRGYRAYDHDGRPIGFFDSQDDAAKAVYET
jgi:hypothetical protein